MTFLSTFSDIDALRELKFSERMTEDGLLVSQGGSDFTLVRNSFGPASAVDPNLCITYPCRADHTGEAQFSAVKIRGEAESTVGYVFPIASLTGGASIENEWARRYAWVAVNALLTDTARFLLDAVRPQLASLRDGETPIDELFSDRLGIAVISKDAFGRVGIPVRYGRMLLMAGGVRFPRQLRVRPGTNEPHSTEPISCPRPAVGFQYDEVPELLIEVADSTDSEIGTFITLYQNIEIVLSRLFVSAVSAAPDSSLSAWDMKDRLKDVTRETWRLSVLDRLCIGSIDRSATTRLAYECHAFLTHAGRNVKRGTAWWQALYLVRNTIVHEQTKAIRGDYFNLDSINKYLRPVCLDIIFQYKEPDAAAVWAGNDTLGEDSNTDED